MDLLLGQEGLAQLSQRNRPTSSLAVVGRYGACEMGAAASDHAMQSWKEWFQKKHMPDLYTRSCGPSFCNMAENLYFYDRCWNPRRTCVVKVGTGTSSSTLVVAQRDSEAAGMPLHAGKYLTVIGPAAAFGVGAMNGFADTLRSQLGMPVVNLGRGGAGPSLYLDENERVTELLAQARAVIMLVMAGRSSPNSAYPRGVRAMVRSEGIERIRANDPARAARLMNESLSSASEEYATMASRIRSAAQRLGASPPELLLMWFSECDLVTGCTHPGQFPQFFTAGKDGLVRQIAQRMGARLIDASYGHVSPARPLALDKCAGCVGQLTGRRTCSMDESRAEMNAPSMRKGNASAFGDASYRSWSLLQGCTRSCGAVLPSYYPHDSAHEHAANILMRELRPILARSSAGPFSSATRTASPARGGLMAHALLPKIDISKKIFFNHVHKCAGSTFTTFLRAAPGMKWCDHLVAADMVHTSSPKHLTEWWFDSIPNCSFLALESPSLGELMTSTAETRQARMRIAKPGELPLDFYEPQVFTFYRDPYDRCLSEWRYEQAVCHPPGGLHSRPKHTADYCTSWFLPQFGRYNSTATHLAFVREYCTERISADYVRHGLDFRELARSDRLLFVGIAEDYFASTCLFWYQAGRFPFDTCSCEGVRKAGKSSNALELEAKGLRRSFSYRSRFDPLGVPELKLSRDQFERRNVGDAALYREARAMFEIRVRMVEKRVGQRFSNCQKI